ncbi:Zn-ribbon domain-containing OB-fold protein [Nocardioides sp. SYSU DS0663]|uniref:Zn-ribbon domain-containing OB-fold protein n=1 Tax=Nocardioides sp. SYSU DS0663 TaxID=3416445 RepID=UPI003F4B8BE6
MTTTATPAIEGWFTTGPEPALVGSRCTTCTTVYFPPVAGFCRNPACAGEEFERTELARRGRVWSYTDAQYQPPAPYVPAADPYEPFALVAVELPEGLTVLGQVAQGYGVDDLRVGAEVELVVETLYRDDTGDRLIWRFKPVVEMGEEADQ